jgi:hypothetical protein
MKSTIDRFSVDMAGSMELDVYGDWCHYYEAEAELDSLATKLDAALREVRELHGELTNTRATVAALLEVDADEDATLARLGACQERVAELEAELSGSNTL